MEEKKMAGYPKKDDKSGTYYFVLENGKGVDGKRKRIVRKGFKKLGEAKEAMKKLMLEISNSENFEESNMSLSEYLIYWLENYAETNTKPKTFAEYEKIIKKHLQPSLGHILLYKLKSTQLQSYYKEKLEGLSAQSVLHHHRLLSKALNDAVDWEFINKNVAKGAKPPKPVKSEMKTLNVEQLNLLFKTAKGKSPTYFPVIYGAAHTGMRKSELMGLNWQNVDFTSNKLYITQTITEANGKYFFNPIPKGKKPRGLKLTAELSKLLKELKDEYVNLKKDLGKTYNPHNLVFCNSKGNIMAPSEITRALKRVLKAAGLPDIRFHDLRHSHASVLLSANIHPKIVSDRLGHSKIGITLDTYSHLTDSLEGLAVESLDELLD
ncbi:tyrosine-type recombinase/integrase [Neobacillus sp. SAB-20_R2A]|uniref:site-specific integrase n=1 Tax=Neobacillus sp. SAB-20_R2A TaxID=3120519 RepID=UPI003C6E6A97